MQREWWVQGVAGEQRVESEVVVERPADGVAVVRLVGEHDLVTKSAIDAAFKAALDAGEALVVDLTETEFIDSSTIHALGTGNRRASEGGCGFVVVIAGNGPVLQVFELTGLLAQIESAPTVDEAISALRA